MRNTLKAAFKGEKNAKNQFLEYERLSNRETYAFTFNPIDQPNFGTPLAVKDWFDSMSNLFNSLKYSSVRMYVEVSKTGRFHLHGFIKIYDRLRFTIYDISKFTPFGSSKIDTMNTPDDYAIWLCYCLKQQNEMQDYLYDHLYSIFDTKHKKRIERKENDGMILIRSKEISEELPI